MFRLVYTYRHAYTCIYMPAFMCACICVLACKDRYAACIYASRGSLKLKCNCVIVLCNPFHIIICNFTGPAKLMDMLPSLYQKGKTTFTARQKQRGLNLVVIKDKSANESSELCHLQN